MCRMEGCRVFIAAADTEQITKIWDALYNYVNNMKINAVDFLINLFISIIIFLIGWYIIKLLLKIFMKAMKKAKADPGVTGFLNSLVGSILRIVLIVFILSFLGFDVTALITALGAAAVTIALALKDNLSNIASGTLIILTKKFKIGDFIETEGIIGEVIKIDMMFTTLRTYDYKEVVIPNARLTANNVINHFSLDSRRLEIPVSIAYREDVEKAREAIMSAINKSDYVLKERANRVEVERFAESGVNLIIWVWVNSENYWNALFDMRQQIKTALDSEGISIPFNQLDLHLDSKDSLRDFEALMEERNKEENK